MWCTYCRLQKGPIRERQVWVQADLSKSRKQEFFWCGETENLQSVVHLFEYDNLESFRVGKAKLSIRAEVQAREGGGKLSSNKYEGKKSKLMQRI